MMCLIVVVIPEIFKKNGKRDNLKYNCYSLKDNKNNNVCGCCFGSVLLCANKCPMAKKGRLIVSVDWFLYCNRMSVRERIQNHFS